MIASISKRFSKNEESVILICCNIFVIGELYSFVILVSHVHP